MPDIDDMIADEEAEQRRDVPPQNKPLEYMFSEPMAQETELSDRQTTQNVLVGKVEHFFEKINVAAVQLSGNLRIGDIIEIRDDKGAVRVQVSSMQINKQNVEEAYEGDSVGIKVDKPINPGSKVYVMNINFENLR